MRRQTILTDQLLRRVTTGRKATVDPLEVVTIPPEPASLFAGLAPSRLIGNLARIDALPVTPKSNVISAIYYFRLACACYFLWNEEHRPLLSNQPPSDPEPGVVGAELAVRSDNALSAFELVAGWAADTDQRRKPAQPLATSPCYQCVCATFARCWSAPVSLLKANRYATFAGSWKLAFRAHLYAAVGEIQSDDPRSLARILDEVAQAARSLSPAMYSLLDDLIATAPTT